MPHRLAAFGPLSALALTAISLASTSVIEVPVENEERTKTAAERLGYPADAKLLIIHADDLAVAHSVDAASFAALESGAVTSASVMAPCPWLTEVADWAKLHPDADLGLHLTLTSEWKTYRWGPVAPADQVPTLLDPHGYFFPDVETVARRATPAEVEREIRAQVERAISLGIHPTHLDMHMGTLAARQDYYAVLVKVAHEYHLPFLAVRVADERAKWLSTVLGPNDVVLDSLTMFDSSVAPERWTESYIQALKSLGPGLHEMIVHLGHDDAELQAIAVDHPDYGAAWRARDYRAVTSPEFRRAISENHIVLLHWKDIKNLASSGQ